MANPFTTGSAPLALQAGSDLATQQAQLQRQQLFADQLRKQALQPDSGTQVISGWAVKKSPLEGLSKIADALTGAYLQSNADSRSADLTKQSNQMLVEGLKQYAQTAQGTPAQDLPATTPNDDEGNPMPLTHIDAVNGNPQQAALDLINSNHPLLQQLGTQQLVTALSPRQAKWEKAELPNQDGSKRVGYVDINSTNPLSTFQEGGTAPVELKSVDTGGGTTFVNPYQPSSQGAPVIGKTANPYSDLVVGGPNGSIVPNQPLVSAKKEIARSGATNVNVAAPENKYNQDVGAGLAKEGLAVVDAARTAPQAVANAQSIRKALDAGAITGTGAEGRLQLQRALETAGLVGPGKAGTTEALMASLGTITLDSIKSSGLGAGQGFTDKDREFLSQAKSGQITATPQNLRRVADLSEKIARANYAKGATVLGRWKADPALKNISQDTVLDPLPDTLPTSNSVGNGDLFKNADAILNRGK